MNCLRVLEKQDLEKEDLLNKIESLFNLIFFELTCRYGIKHGRPLIIMVMLTFFFSIPYIFVLIWPPEKDGIWKILRTDRVRQNLGKEKPKELLHLPFFSALKFGFYFSLLPAFSIGVREINVRGWLIRLQQREYFFTGYRLGENRLRLTVTD